MRFFETSGARYIDASEAQLIDKKPIKKIRKPFKKALFSSLATIVGITILASSLQLSALSASAIEEKDPNDGTSQAEDKLKELTQGQDMTQNGFDNLFSQGRKEGPSNGTFASVINRLFTISYSNSVPLAQGAPASGLYCNVNASGKETLVYHNCDVPNIITEFAQDLISLFASTGGYKSEVQSATMLHPGFGIPVALIPDGKVPVNRSSGTPKYTALEIYGYGLTVSGYLGEWDHIKVMTQARMLSNFGLMDHIALGGNIVWNSTAAIVNNVADSASQFSGDLASGDVIGALFGFLGSFSKIAETGLATAVNTIFDTSDYNIITQNAWYRLNYNNTAYGTRQLTSLETSSEALASMTKLIDESVNKNESAVLPGDFPPSALPQKPQDSISSCSIQQYSGDEWTFVSYGNVSSSPGTSEASCKAAADRAASSGEGKPTGARFQYDKEGTQKLETIEAWTGKHKAIFDGISKYGINCTINTSEGSRTANINSFYGCYAGDWQRAADETLDEEKIKNNTVWQKLVLSSYVMAQWFSQQDSANFNASYNRYICVDSKGNDLRDETGLYLRVYNKDGSLTGNCSGTRPPIQDGLFGNGYIKGAANQNVENDTRRDSFSPSLFKMQEFSTDFANFSLTISSFTTKISNLALSLSFAPILETLGINDLIIDLVESFRDGIFFPLIALVVSIAAFTTFIRFVRAQAFAEAISSMIYIVVSFIVGIILLTNPAKTISFIDTAPMMIENTVLSAFYGASNDDLCTATGTPGSNKVEGIDGLVSNQKNVVRTMTCETWRTFVFTPWVYSQWGSSYESLYAKGYANGYGASGVKNSSLKNSNESLVGDASVNFGGSKTINNWAIYQLAMQSSGTSTTADTSRPTGITDKNWYKLVDAQAGPNNGAQSDGRFFKAWTGEDIGNRLSVALFSPVVSILGMITIVTYSFLKISLSIMTVLMLVILPIILLMGVHPTFGRRMLKSYAWQIIGLMIQRIFLTLLLAVMMRLIVAVSSAATGYIIAATTVSVLLIVFLSYKNEILGLIQKGMDASGGAFMGGMAYGGVGALKQHVPTTSIDNAIGMTKTQIKGASTGFVAGVTSGAGLKDTIGLMGRNAKVSSQREGNKQVRAGLGAFQLNQQVQRAVDTQAEKRFNSEEMFDARTNMLRAGSPGQFDNNGNYLTNELTIDSHTNRLSEDGLVRNLDSNGQPIVGARSNNRMLGSTVEDRRALKQFNDIEKALHAIESKAFQSVRKSSNNDTDNLIANAQNQDDAMNNLVLNTLGQKASKNYEALKRKKDRLLTKQSEVYNNEFAKSDRRAERRTLIDNLKDTLSDFGEENNSDKT